MGGVGFLTTLEVGVGIFCPTPDVQLDHFLHHTPKLGIPVEMVQFLLELLLKQRFLAVYHDFHAKFHSFYVKESESEFLEVGVGYLTSESATLLKIRPSVCGQAIREKQILKNSNINKRTMS